METLLGNFKIGHLALADPAALGLPPWPWRTILITSAVLTYLTAVQVLRFRALRRITAKYASYVDDPYRLDYRQAQEIMHVSMLYEMPFLFVFGTQWALIKSYGIANGTRLLVQTRQLCDADKVGKRAEDTAVFLVELLAGDPDGARGRLALAKLNWMHGRYRIAQGDYLHTLALFVLEPQLWVERYGWRRLTALEKVAYFVYWREIGHRMGIGGIPDTLEALARWRVAYEKDHLYYAPENRIVVDAAVDMFLRRTPRPLRGAVRSLFVSFIDDRAVRESLGYPDPPAWATALTTSFFRLHGFAVRHFCLPRLRPLDPVAKPGPDGRLYRSPDAVAFEPWYVADTWYNRVVVWLKSGGTVCPGAKFQSRGFLPEELGPAAFEKASKEPVYEQARALEEYIKNRGATGAGCPFSFR
ncbi:hypothetical protein F4775DRAFT_580150 [Biscogniauxia sp. FL1348]|nr:hypothetical protein F4775DRAFT_580150 [Biscogniauxia sp. FL1348]